MTFQAGHIPTTRGQNTTTRPFTKIEDIQAIKLAIQDSLRDLAMFTFAVNTGLRGSDIVALRRWQLEATEDGCLNVVIKERKTQKNRTIKLNKPTTDVLLAWLNSSSGEFVFEGQRGQMTVAYYGRLCKAWAEKAGLCADHIATHSLRKTFVRVNHDHFGTSLTTLQWMLNHSSSSQTLVYMGLTPDDAAKAYGNAV
jgi:integrase